MNKSILFLILFFAGSQEINAQQEIQFPILEEYVTPECKVFNIWTPSASFLRQNPNFNATGEYKLNLNMMNRPQKQGRMQSYGYALREISSSNYPAVFFSANEKLDIGVRVHIGFDNSIIPVAKRKAIVTNYSAQELFVPYDDVTISKQEFENLNSVVRNKFNALGRNKIEGDFVVSDLNRSMLVDSAFSIKDIFLEYEHVKTVSTTKAFSDSKLFGLSLLAPVAVGAALIDILDDGSEVAPMLIVPAYFGISKASRKHPSAPNVPSHSIYQLHIKDASGTELKTYSQVIFIKENHLLRKSDQYLYVLFRQTFSVAAESLLNQFINDKNLILKIKNQGSHINSILAANPSLLPATRLQKRYFALINQKKAIIDQLQDIELQLKSMGVGFNSDVVTSNYHHQYNSNISSQANANINAAGDAAVFMIGAISNASQKAKIKKLESRFENLKDQLNTLGKAEREVRNEMIKYVGDEASMDKLISSSEDIDKKISDLASSVEKQATNSRRNISNSQSSLTNWYNNSLQSFNSSLNQPSVESSAIPSSGGAAPPCMQEVNSRLAGSEEQARYNSSKLNSDAVRLKAKLIELTLEYCGDQFSEEQKSNLRKLRNDMLNGADKMQPTVIRD